MAREERERTDDFDGIVAEVDGPGDRRRVFTLTLASWPAWNQDGGDPRLSSPSPTPALAAISRGDMAALTDLMLPKAVMFPTFTRDGVARYRLRTRAEHRAATVTSKVTERVSVPRRA